jgi:hypothetical protein
MRNIKLLVLLAGSVALANPVFSMGNDECCHQENDAGTESAEVPSEIAAEYARVLEIAHHIRELGFTHFDHQGAHQKHPGHHHGKKKHHGHAEHHAAAEHHHKKHHGKKKHHKHHGHNTHHAHHDANAHGEHHATAVEHHATEQM